MNPADKTMAHEDEDTTPDLTPIELVENDDDLEQTRPGEREWKSTPTLDPLLEVQLTKNLYHGWRKIPLKEKRDLIIARLPRFLKTHLYAGVDQKGFKKLQAKTARELLCLMSKNVFDVVLRQLGHTPIRFIYGTAGHPSNVEYELRMRISSTDITNMTGMAGLPDDSLPNYLEPMHTILSNNSHSLELLPPPQRGTLPPVGRDGNLPNGQLLKEYIYESRSTVDGSIQSFEFFIKSSYGKLGKPYRDQTISGITMALFVNAMTEMRLRHLQIEKRPTGASPCLFFQGSYPETDGDRAKAELSDRARGTGRSLDNIEWNVGWASVAMVKTKTHAMTVLAKPEDHLLLIEVLMWVRALLSQEQ